MKTIKRTTERMSPQAPLENIVSRDQALSPDPEVMAKRPRRTFTAQYKLRILEKVDASSAPGEVGAILRREGLYSSHLTKWRSQRTEGSLQGLSAKKRGRKKIEVSPLAKRLAELERENARLRNRLKKAETIIDVQKKMSEILGISQDHNGELD